MSNKLAEFQKIILPQLEEQLNSYLNGLNAAPTLKKAMLYSLESGGKRIRPMLLLAICHMFNRQIDEGVFAAAGSLELLHTYSLIHDDLPEMDNDDLRRGGRPTNHKVFGQAEAVLAGDGLLTTAFEWLASCHLSAQLKVALLSRFATAAGPQGMVSGQIADIEGEKKELTLVQLKALHQLKTGALLQYACQAGGGIISGATAAQMTELLNFGSCFGLAFQIYDDILDVVSTQAELGKAVHKDQVEHKNTYPGLLGLNGAYQELDNALLNARTALNELKHTGIETGILDDFLRYFSRKDN
nr:farnesyl diphosphate synthase [Liquorilactobacillus satsumensis]